MTTPRIPAGQGETTFEPRSDGDELVAFLRGRSAPCPRCGYELRDLDRPVCPECGEPLVLRVGSPRPRFGWMVVAMAPGCFSGVAATLLLVPLIVTWRSNLSGNRGMPIPLQCAVLFGFLSAASVGLFYRSRHRFMALPSRRQMWLAIGVWLAHILAFAALVGAMFLWV